MLDAPEEPTRSRTPRRFGSAHVIGVVALVFALGGGYAGAKKGLEPAPTVGYQATHMASERHDGESASLVTQLVFPTGTDLAVSAKLNIRKPRRSGFSSGRVTCFLATIGRRDRAVARVARGDAANLSLQSMGSFGQPGSTNAVDLYCRSKRSDYIVSDARISAISLDEIGDVSP
jgi:hypothetical protein